MSSATTARFGFDLPHFVGVGLAIALGLIVALFVALPKGERKLARTPIAFVVFYVLASLTEMLATPPHAKAIVYQAVGVFFLFASIGRSALLLVLHAVFVRRLSAPMPTILRDLLQGLVYLSVGFIALRMAGVELGSLLTTSAFLTAVIGLSLQDTLGNLFSGLAIQAQRPFSVGDWIQYGTIEDHIGEVIEMNWRTVTLRTVARNEVTVPNAMLGRAPIINFSRPVPVSRHVASVWVSMDVPPHNVHRLLLSCVKGVRGVVADPPPDVLTKAFTDRGVQYDVRYYVESYQQRERTLSEVRSRVWYALHRARMKMCPPQRDIYLHEVSEAALQHEREARLRHRREAFRRIDFLSVLPDDVQAQLAELSEERVYAAGEVVIQEGEPGTELFMVDEGEVAVEISKGARQKQVAQLGKGHFFGEMSLLTGAVRSATVRAVTDTTVLVIDKSALQTVLDASPDLAGVLSRALAQREEQLEEAATTTLTNSQKALNDRDSLLLARIKSFFSLGPR